MRQNWLILALCGLATFGVTSCAKPPRPKLAVQPPPPPPPPPPPKPHKPKPPPVHAPVLAKWQFNPADCSGTASGGTLSLDISVSARQLALVVRTGGKAALRANGAVPIGFTGANGSWTLNGTVAGKHRISAAQAMTENTAGQIKVLIEGGMVKFGGAGAMVPRLRVPNSGQPGSDWFACVKQRLQP